MSSPVIFDGVELRQPELFEEDIAVETSETRLLSGKISAQISAETGLAVTFNCNTKTLADITNLQAKIGTFGTLQIDSASYTNCYITTFKKKKTTTEDYEYTVGFKRKTT
jgi:hypothetical protein